MNPFENLYQQELPKFEMPTLFGAFGGAQSPAPAPAVQSIGPAAPSPVSAGPALDPGVQSLLDAVGGSSGGGAEIAKLYSALMEQTKPKEKEFNFGRDLLGPALAGIGATIANPRAGNAGVNAVLGYHDRMNSVGKTEAAQRSEMLRGLASTLGTITLDGIKTKEKRRLISDAMGGQPSPSASVAPPPSDAQAPPSIGALPAVPGTIVDPGSSPAPASAPQPPAPAAAPAAGAAQPSAGPQLAPLPHSTQAIMKMSIVDDKIADNMRAQNDQVRKDNEFALKQHEHNPKFLAEREMATEEAKIKAKTKASLPTILSNTEDAVNNVVNILNDPNLSGVTGVQGWMPTLIPSNRTLESKIKQSLGQAYAQAMETARGTGSVSNAEGQALAASYSRLEDMKQDDEGYREALRDFAANMIRINNAAHAKAGVEAPANDRWLALANEDGLRAKLGGKPKAAPEGQTSAAPAKAEKPAAPPAPTLETLKTELASAPVGTEKWVGNKLYQKTDKGWEPSTISGAISNGPAARALKSIFGS